MSKQLWEPSEERIKNSNINNFIKLLINRTGNSFETYEQLHSFSVECPEVFWNSLWEFSGVVAQTKGDTILVNAEKMPGASWFPQARLNFAENLLKDPSQELALTFYGEDRVRETLTRQELYDLVSLCAQALKALGIQPGDRVAGYMPNMPHTIIMFLAAASIGAIWSSCSPDFGIQGALDRFGQIKPKVLLGVDGYYYNGKSHDCLSKLEEIAENIPSLVQVVVVPYINQLNNLSSNNFNWFDDFIRPYKTRTIDFEQLPFDHPLFIMFSSGTTGVPKCIVHSAGGTLLQHLKEHQLHTDIKEGDKFFYFTTCGWMMWNWLVTGLASKASLVLYDGSVFYPDEYRLFELAEKEKITVFGTSAKYIDSLIKLNSEPGKKHDLTSIKTLLSTGSPLSPEGYEFVYDKVNSNLCLSSIAGGTDILSCFALGATILPVWSGELQCIGLGMDVKVLDEKGEECAVGEKGELCCMLPFPSMPIGFWKDESDERYHAAYFSSIDNVWCHGDYVSMTERGGMIFHGRSDAVLNPGGVRIGTAEIYRQVEKIDEVIESIVIGQNWDNDVRVVLFVKLREGVELDEDLNQKIRTMIRQNASPRHVPAKILRVEDIPRTKSGKIVELAVRSVVHGESVKNKESLENPQALAFFKNRKELKS